MRRTAAFTPAGTDRTRLRDWLALIVAMLLLNVTLTMENVWPGLGVAPAARLSVEAAGLMLCAALRNHQ